MSPVQKALVEVFVFLAILNNAEEILNVEIFLQ